MRPVDIANATGSAGGVAIDNTITAEGLFLDVFFVANSTLDTTNCDSNIDDIGKLAGVTFGPGQHLMGRFTKVSLSTGKAVLYNAR